MKLLIAIGAVLGAMTQGAAAQPGPAVKPVDVMVLGTWHFDNPGQDLNNVKADDVLKPGRQAELEALANAIAAYKPTKIMVERVARTPDLLDPNFASFTPEKLRKERDERYQVGYRLAHRLKLGKVYAIDEQPGPGDPDYFPFGKVVEFAKANNAGGQLQALMAKSAAETKAFEEKQQRLGTPRC